MVCSEHTNYAAQTECVCALYYAREKLCKYQQRLQCERKALSNQEPLYLPDPPAEESGISLSCAVVMLAGTAGVLAGCLCALLAVFCDVTVKDPMGWMVFTAVCALLIPISAGVIKLSDKGRGERDRAYQQMLKEHKQARQSLCRSFDLLYARLDQCCRELEQLNAILDELTGSDETLAQVRDFRSAADAYRQYRADAGEWMPESGAPEASFLEFGEELLEKWRASDRQIPACCQKAADFIAASQCLCEQD